jgi:L-fuconolactonase
MSIIDAHHHLWDPGKRAYPWMSDTVDPIRRAFTIDQLRDALPQSVAKTIVVQAVSSVEETEDLLRIAAQSRGLIAGVVGWVDLTSPTIDEEIARLRHGPGGESLVGIRHQVHDEEDPRWLERLSVLRGLAAVAKAGLTFDLLIRAREIPTACIAVHRLPELQFVVDHGAKPQIATSTWEPWSTELEKISTFPNVACKLSGLVTEADWQSWEPHDITPYIRRLVDLFAPDRLIFGSDWPVCLLAASYDRVVSLVEDALSNATPPEREAVFSKNAIRIYHLVIPSVGAVERRSRGTGETNSVERTSSNLERNEDHT